MNKLKQFFTLANAVKKIQPRIPVQKAALMIGFALAIDLLQIFIDIFLDWLFIGVVINWFIDVAMAFTLWLWFKLNRVEFIQITGVKTSNTTGLIAFLITIFLKLIPILDALPAWTVDTIINIAVSWTEDLAAQDTSGTLAGFLPGGREALSSGAKKQAEEAQAENERRGVEGYSLAGLAGEEKKQEEKKKGASNALDLSGQGAEGSGKSLSTLGADTDRKWQERDARSAEEERERQERMGGIGADADKKTKEMDERYEREEAERERNLSTIGADADKKARETDQRYEAEQAERERNPSTIGEETDRTWQERDRQAAGEERERQERMNQFGADADRRAAARRTQQGVSSQTGGQSTVGKDHEQYTKKLRAEQDAKIKRIAEGL